MTTSNPHYRAKLTVDLKDSYLAVGIQEKFDTAPLNQLKLTPVSESSTHPLQNSVCEIGLNSQVASGVH